MRVIMLIIAVATALGLQKSHKTKHQLNKVHKTKVRKQTNTTAA